MCRISSINSITDYDLVVFFTQIQTPFVVCAWRSLHGLLASGNTSSTAKWAAKPSFRCDKNDRKLQGRFFESSEKVIQLYVNMLTTFISTACWNMELSIIGPPNTVIVSVFLFVVCWFMSDMSFAHCNCGHWSDFMWCYPLQHTLPKERPKEALGRWEVLGMRGLESIGSWWFQIFLIFTPIWGGDSHFDY